MSRSLNIARLVAVTLVLFGQGVWSFGGIPQAKAGVFESTIVICTPLGLKVITLAPASNEDPADTPGATCLLCVMAADLPAPDLAARQPVPTIYQSFCPISSPVAVTIGAVAPHPARAPPFDHG